MNLETKTPGVLAILPLLVGFVQSKLPSDASDLVMVLSILIRTIQHRLCTNPYRQRTRSSSIARTQCRCMQPGNQRNISNTLLTSEVMTSWSCSVTPS